MEQIEGDKGILDPASKMHERGERRVHVRLTAHGNAQGRHLTTGKAGPVAQRPGQVRPALNGQSRQTFALGPPRFPEDEGCLASDGGVALVGKGDATLQVCNQDRT